MGFSRCPTGMHPARRSIHTISLGGVSILIRGRMSQSTKNRYKLSVTTLMNSLKIGEHRLGVRKLSLHYTYTTTFMKISPRLYTCRRLGYPCQCQCGFQTSTGSSSLSSSERKPSSHGAPTPACMRAGASGTCICMYVRVQSRIVFLVSHVNTPYGIWN